MIRRREFIKGAAALAAYADLKNAEARTGLGLTSDNGIVYPLAPIASRASIAENLVANTGVAGGGTATQFQGRGAHTILANGTFDTIVMRFANLAGDPLANGLDAVTLRVGVKMSSGSFYAAYWANGTRAIVLQPGDVADCTVRVPPVGRGERFLTSRFGTFASAIVNWPGTMISNFASDEPVEFGTALTDKTVSGAFFGNPATPMMFLPCAIMGHVAGTPGPSVLIDGNGVIALGQDDGGETNSVHLNGFAQRGLQAANIPWAVLGNQGMTNASIQGAASINLRYGPLVGCGYTHALIGGSDVFGNPARTAAQAYGDVVSIGTKLAAIGIKAVIQAPCPRTNATNDGIFASQDDANVWPERLNYINLLVANNGVGYGVFRFDQSCSGGGDPNLWRTDLGPYNLNGSHPTPAIHTQAKNDLVAAAPTLFV